MDDLRRVRFLFNGLLILGVILAKAFVFYEWFFLALLALLLIIASIIIYGIYWRCPYCNKHIYHSFYIQRCPNCGKRLFDDI